MRGNNKWKMRLFRFLSILIMAVVSLLGIETSVYLFSKTGRLSLATRNEIVSVSKTELEETKTVNPIYIPHPYFGYVYTPSSRISQFNYVTNTPVYMESNSEGFIDEEFPPEKREGLCIYGILGGSAAMGWGVDKREDRISSRLEKLLNAHLRDEKCREYRVLNMGIGSHTLYQGTQVYLYYSNLLDGVIFFGGFNECAHGAMLTNNDPVQFPVVNLYASLQMPSPLILKILEGKRELAERANFLLKHPYLIYSPSLRFLFKLKTLRIEKLQGRLQDEGHQTALPGIKGKYKQRLQGLFPGFSPLDFLQSHDHDNPDVPRILEKILPLVYTEPILNAYAVSKTANAHFLSVIQPMIYVTGRESNWKERNFASYHFQKCCVEKLMEQARKLESYGLKTYNLNEIDKGAYRKDFFIDQVHLTNEGTELVARSLFELIKKEWHN